MRLIDADALKVRFTEELFERSGLSAQGIIDEAPTIEPSGDLISRPTAEWIPCSERLPDKNGWYLVTVQGYETLTDVSLYSADDGCAWGDVSAKQKVIAWMPLPKPYRGE